MQLRELLPARCRNWVASASSLMAVPLRGKMLAEELAPLVGTVLETHPRACLRAVLTNELHSCIDGYKERGSPGVAALASAWQARFLIEGAGQLKCDGELDSIVCATVALTYHRSPEQLLHLRSPDCQLRGNGPFYTFSFS
jgi:predicted nuclease with RNAse H fold